MKIVALNQVIEIKNSTGFIPAPFYDVNYSSNLILVSNHIQMVDNVDKELLNAIILKATIDLLNVKYGNINSKDNVVLQWLISKIDITKEIYEMIDNKKIRYFRSKV